MTIFAIILSTPVLSRANTFVFINEFHYDNVGTDTDEAIELAGPAGLELTDWRIVLYNGANGLVYNTRVLSGVIPDLQNGYGTISFLYPADGIQNGAPDGIALVNSSDALVQFLSYEGSFTGLGGPADGVPSTDIGVSEQASTSAGYSLQLAGAGGVYSDFSWGFPMAHTFGAVNTGQTFRQSDVIPEPPPMLLLGIGLLVAGILRHRPKTTPTPEVGVGNVVSN